MAKILGINHVAFAVKDMEKAIKTAVEGLGGEILIKFESLESKYKGACLQLGDSIISILEATDPDSFIAKHVETRGEGVQHVGLEIDNLKEYVEELESRGIRVEKSGMEDETFTEALVGPKIGNGVVLQLMQWKDGIYDTSPGGKERLRRKYSETPGLKLIE